MNEFTYTQYEKAGKMNEKCCIECLNYSERNSDGSGFDDCNNLNCPCHTKQPENQATFSHISAGENRVIAYSQPFTYKGKESEKIGDAYVVFPEKQPDDWETTAFDPILEDLQSGLINKRTARISIVNILRNSIKGEKEKVRAEIENVSTIGIGAIPETTDFAKGWNECRKEYYSRRFKPFRDQVLALLEK